MDTELKGYIPGNTNHDFIYLTGAILSWWARIEGIMVHDIYALRTWPFSAALAVQDFPDSGQSVVKHWRKLLDNGYKHFGLEQPDLSRLVNDALELLEHRNTLIHSFWPYGQKDANVLELHWIKRSKKGEWGVSRGTYTATLQQLDNINTRLAHLYTAVMAASFNSHKLCHQSDSADPP